jgi:hypothetical protein
VVDLAIQPSDEPKGEAQDLLPPLAHEKTGGIMNHIPTLSFDDSISSEDSTLRKNVLALEEISRYTRKFKAHIQSLKQKWAQAFTEVEEGYGLMIEDLKNLHRIMAGVSTMVGSPVHQGSL